MKNLHYVASIIIINQNIVESWCCYRFYSIFNNPNKKFSGKVSLIFTHAYPGDDFYRPYIDLVIKQPFEMNTELEMVDCLEVGGVKFIGDADNAEDALKKAYGIGLKF